MRAGDHVPDFELPDQSGEVVRLGSLLRTGPVVLFFYPAAMTPGCTKESCHFRDLEAEFAAVGAHRVGISADEVDTQREFSDRYRLDFPLLSDPERRVADTFGVKRRIGLLPNRRSTFVIDTDSTVLEVVSSEMSMDHHADRALEVLRERAERA